MLLFIEIEEEMDIYVEVYGRLYGLFNLGNWLVVEVVLGDVCYVICCYYKIME